MKQILTLIIAIFATSLTHANVVAEADSAYLNDKYSEAAALYTQAIEQLGPSAERYYNLGNANYRLGNLGAAILNYERALRLDPSNSDIRENLEFVNSKTVDKIENPESFVNTMLGKIGRLMNPNAWIFVAVGFFVLTLIGVALYFFSHSIVVRKVGFFGAGVTLILCVLINILAYRETTKATAENEAIVMVKSVNLSTTPRTPMSRSEEALLLHEGAKVYILNSITPADETWYDVKVDDNHRAWIPASAIEII